MRHVLATRNVEILEQFASSHLLLAFDFDGTLAPIVGDRDKAAMRPRTRKLLSVICNRYPCAVISGRSRKDVADRLRGLHIPHVVGNHGAEHGRRMASFARVVSGAKRSLVAALREHQGIDIEDKVHSLALHYRRSRRKGEARRAIVDVVASLDPPMRLVAGKLVINVIPAGAPHKGDALQRVRAAAGADAAIYVGDDVTDEDVFELDQPGRLLCIRVGRSASSAASYYLRNQVEIDALLQELLRLRADGARR